MNTPQCIGVIMDGNRRWAKAKGLPTFEGHRQGYNKLKDIVEWCQEARIGSLIVFAFSEENWKRAEDEVGFMLTLIREIIRDQVKEAMEKNIKLRFIGRIERFPEDIAQGFTNAETKTAGNTGLTLAICVSYGGREEIVHAVNQAVKNGQEVSIESFSNYLYTTGLPDPDIVIRTSGEVRLSGFLPWQTVYSEFFFTQTLWPDFSKEEFQKTLEQYVNRDRRLGK